MSAVKSKSKSPAEPWNAEAVVPLSTVMYFFVAESGAIVSQPGEGVNGYAILLRSYQNGAPRIAVCGLYVAAKAGREVVGQDTRKLLLTTAEGHTGYGIPVPGSVVVDKTQQASWPLHVAGAILTKMAEFAATLDARRLAA